MSAHELPTIEQWMRRPPGWLEKGLLLTGFVLLGMWLRSYDEARTFRMIESKRFEIAKEATPPSHRSSSASWFPETLESGVFGRLEIPRLGITALIAEGTSDGQLDKAVGHFTSSPFPGQDGNCALAGHRDSFLKGLGKVRKKDVIRIDTLQDSYTYEVEWGSVVAPDQVDVLDPTSKPTLTLVTCYPFQAVGPAPERFVVRAKLVNSTD